MPIYEYRCKSCGETFEYMQRMSDDPLTECEKCAGPLERLISQSAFHLKGSGWYKDLYSSPKKDAASGSDSADTPKSAAGGSSSSDSGGAAKSDSGGAAKSDSGSSAPSKAGSSGGKD